jgi:hypothetical protein
VPTPTDNVLRPTASIIQPEPTYSVDEFARRAQACFAHLVELRRSKTIRQPSTSVENESRPVRDVASERVERVVHAPRQTYGGTIQIKPSSPTGFPSNAANGVAGESPATVAPAVTELALVEAQPINPDSTPDGWAAGSPVKVSKPLPPLPQRSVPPASPAAAEGHRKEAKDHRDDPCGVVATLATLTDAGLVSLETAPNMRSRTEGAAPGSATTHVTAQTARSAEVMGRPGTIAQSTATANLPSISLSYTKVDPRASTVSSGFLPPQRPPSNITLAPRHRGSSTFRVSSQRLGGDRYRDSCEKAQEAKCEQRIRSVRSWSKSNQEYSERSCFRRWKEIKSLWSAVVWLSCC